jgi:ferredoxin
MERFPPPDFESGYAPPATMVSPPRSVFYEYLDVAALGAALALAAWLALKARSRTGLFFLTLFSLAYFGFWRGGCVCPVGATQDVALSLTGGGSVLPLATIAFFVLPLASAVFFGRIFCASVCPLGAIQDIVLVKPVKVPQWLEHPLGLLAYVYLGLAVVFAVTGSAFLICRYDPFVSFFRLSGSTGMLALGTGFLAVGTLIGRPYCRYLCPYGALLRPLSSVSMRHATITPDQCIQCKLCENACPYGAILKPTEDAGVRGRKEGIRRLAGLVVLLPALIISGLWLGAYLGPSLSRMHPTVTLAERVYLEEKGAVKGTTDASEAFRKTGRAPAELYKEGVATTKHFVTWGRILGAWVALVIGLKLVSLTVRRKRTGHEPDKAKCVSCGRCFMSCPHERVRSKKQASLPDHPRPSPAGNPG